MFQSGSAHLKELKSPTLVLCPDTNKFTLPHRLTKNGGNFYKNK
ncbi:MAG: 50S ribosomal protein L32, partial [Sweet potato little leaf phytoplasma]|nr:50S ribosomal protein L32 [Sweet potato little leaf phytoplasma]